MPIGIMAAMQEVINTLGELADLLLRLPSIAAIDMERRRSTRSATSTASRIRLARCRR
jgi:hypothetical protein